MADRAADFIQKVGQRKARPPAAVRGASRHVWFGDRHELFRTVVTEP